MAVTGPDFVALQVRDPERAAHFYETHLGLRRAAVSPPGAIVFDTAPIPFAVREPLPGVDLDAADPGPGVGVALWLAAENPDGIHEVLVDAGVTIPQPPSDGPFGRTFSFVDPDGYLLTVHGR
ncbi:MAG: VOC family protein [Actinobacteria bacterium]|nr:VOC family protein [Actinomycetota bacterium]